MQFTGTEWWIGWTFHSAAAAIAPMLAALGSADDSAERSTGRARWKTRRIQAALVLAVLLTMALHDGITRVGASLLGFAVGTAILCRNGRWTERTAPAVGVCMAYVRGIPPEVAGCGAVVGLCLATAAGWLIRQTSGEFCRIFRGMCGAALFCLAAAELLIP